jgi:AraC-like DNA-binding protein
MPDSTIQIFTDIDEYHASMSGARLDGIVTSRGEFSVRSTRVQFDRLVILRNEETLSRVVKNAFDRDLCLMVFGTRQNQQTVHINGAEISFGDLVAYAGGSEGHNRITAGYHWGAMALTHEQFVATGEALFGRALVPPTATYRVRPPPALMSRLLKLHEAAGYLAETVPDILAKSEVIRTLEYALLEAMVDCITGENAPVVRIATHRRGAVVRRLEEFLEARADKTVYVEELCKATAVSYPTLRGCCQELVGMSPQRYLRMRRMHLARRALRIANPATASVTEIATNYGFWELGRFSVAYRSLFGESPSATLRQPPNIMQDSKIGWRPSELIRSA